MSKRSITVLILIFALFSLHFSAQEKEKTMNISLESCILKALENNLGLAIDILDPGLSEIALAREQEIFYPQFSLSYNRRDSSQASYSFLDSSGQVSTLTSTYSASLNQTVPIGGTLSLSMDGYKTDTNRSFISINPRFSNTFTLNFSQPLLRNFGTKMTKRNIIIAKNNLGISRKQFETNLINTIYSVEDAYWNYVHRIELLNVSRQSLKLAEDLLAKNKRSVEVGSMAPIEILTAESEVATRKAGIIESESQVKNAEDQLKALINIHSEGEEFEQTNLVPSDKPVYEQKKITFDEALSNAYNNRADLASNYLNIENSEINLDYVKNQLLPDLSLNARVWSPGISGTQILFLNNNPYSGVIVGTIPGGSSQAMKDALGFKYKNFTIGLTLSMPFSNIFSRASYAQAKTNLDRAKLQIKNQEQQIFVEIKSALRSVQTDYMKVASYKTARELAKKRLEAEEERLKVGLTTNYFVLVSQREMRNAQVLELKSIIDYNLSLARLSRAMGMTFKDKNISILDLIEE